MRRTIWHRSGQSESPLLRELIAEISTQSEDSFSDFCRNSWERILAEPLDTFVYLPDLDLPKTQADLYSKQFVQVGSLLVALGLLELAELYQKLEDEALLEAAAFKFAFTCARTRDDQIRPFEEILQLLDKTEAGSCSRLAYLTYQWLVQLYLEKGDWEQASRCSLQVDRTRNGPDLFDICAKRLPRGNRESENKQ